MAKTIRNSQHYTSLPRLTAFVIICLTIISLCGCAKGVNDNRIVKCSDDEYTTYPEIVEQILPDHTMTTANNRAFQYVDAGNAAEAFDPQAHSALRAGVAEYWYPHYLATVVIAVDRDMTDADIKTWSDLTGLRDEVGISSALGSNPRINNPMMMAAISFGLEGEDFTLAKAAELLRLLHAEDRLILNSFEPPIVICYDFQSAEMIRNGRNIDVVVPEEGTLTYTKGLLSNSELIFSGSVDDLLLTGGFRLPDGRCDPALYPTAAAYGNASMVTDYEHLITVSQDATRILRQDVLRAKLLASKDDRQHQWWVLIYIIIVVAWMALLIRRIAHENMRKAVLMVGILLLGWIIARLISYQMDLNTDPRRYVNYTYYLFQLSLPIVFMWLAHIVDKNEGRIAMPWWIKIFSAYFIILIIIVYTNDLHNWVYVYDFSDPFWGDHEGHGIFYNLVHRSFQFSLIAVFVIMAFKSRGSIRKRGIFLPLLFVALLTVYQIGYQMLIPLFREGDWTMNLGALIILFTQSLVWAGLIPANTKYATLFNHSPLMMRIFDRHGKPALSSASAFPFEEDMLDRVLETMPAPTLQDENTLLFADKISGGYALWQEDISDLNRLNEEIEESVSKLTAANAMLAEEERIERAAREENEKTQLLSQLETEMSVHLSDLSAMIERLEDADEKTKETIRIMLLLCYVKRRSSLFFREMEGQSLSVEELKAYLDEPAEIAGSLGVSITVNESKTNISAHRAILFYELYYRIIDRAVIIGSPNILAHIGTENGNIELRLLPSCDVNSFQVGEDLTAAIVSAGGTYNVIDLDYASGIRLSFPEEGEDHA